jgi:type II secretory pathway predicted ATPase ExeA
MPEHWLGMTGVPMIKTAAFAQIRATLAACARELSIVAITGDSATGKTFAVQAALEDLHTMQHALISLPPRVSPPQLVALLYGSLTGRAPYRDSRRMLPTVLDRLAERRHLLAFDEAQHLNKTGLELIRYLWDEPRTQFGAALVGDSACWQLLSRYPMLRTRIDAHVAVAALDPASVLRVIPTYHPIYEHADAGLIIDIDEGWCDGRIGEWAKVTRKAAQACELKDSPTLTSEIARESGVLA